MSYLLTLLGIVTVLLIAFPFVRRFLRLRRRNRAVRKDSSSYLEEPVGHEWSINHGKTDSRLLKEDLDSYRQETSARKRSTLRNKEGRSLNPPVLDEAVETEEIKPVNSAGTKRKGLGLTEEQTDQEVAVNDVVEEPISEERATPSKREKATFSRESELILILYVVAKYEPGFLGEDIFAILADLGLRHGEMKIFHHYGVGEVKVKNPVFSIANMLEPGYFDPETMTEFASPGLALFMRLPGPFGGRVAFELMLNSAQRLAEVLEGQLEDEKHQLLTPPIIQQLRERIAHFEQRETPLSLLKRFS